MKVIETAEKKRGGKTAEEWNMFWLEAIPDKRPPPGWKTRKELQDIWGISSGSAKQIIKDMLNKGTLIVQKYTYQQADGRKNTSPYYMRKTCSETPKGPPMGLTPQKRR